MLFDVLLKCERLFEAECWIGCYLICYITEIQGLVLIQVMFYSSAFLNVVVKFSRYGLFRGTSLVIFK